MNNIILIGMPSAGKSTIGVLLAKTLGFNFIDTDLLIQEKEQLLLHEIISKKGLEKFLCIEEEVCQDLQVNKSIIATGGSVVYCEKAMEHLKKIGKIIYIYVTLEEIKERLDNITTRGVAIKKGNSLEDLYIEREPLYTKYADNIVNAKGLDVEEVLNIIISKI